MRFLWLRVPIVAALVLTAACSFRHKDDVGIDNSGGGRAESVNASLSLNPNDDADGDLVTNGEELSGGSNPLVADVPDLKVHFLQNFNLTAGVDAGGASYKISKKLESGDFDFKYRVGKPLIRGKSEREIARVAGFSNAFQGEMNPLDLTLVEYPQLERTRYLTDLVALQKQGVKLDLEGKDVSLDFENSIELTPHHQFKEVKNVELGFWYFNRALDKYELIGKSVVERVFLPGVKETFSIQLTGMPNRLLMENYLRHGELILTEVRDFEIPELKTTYRGLLDSVSAKTLPVVVNDPLETKLSYVALLDARSNLGSILSSLFSGDVEVQDNRIVKIGPYENSTADYKELRELRGQKKSGRWFIFTNQMKHDLWEHPFESTDRLVLTYAEDQVIAEEPSEILTNSFQDVSAMSGTRSLALGTVSANSSLRLLIKGVREFGNQIDQFDDVFQSGGCGSGGNGVCRDFQCRYNRHIFGDFDRAVSFATESELLGGYVRLRLNQESFTLSELVKKEGVTADLRGDDLIVVIDDLEKFFKNSQYGPEDILTLEVQAKNFRDFRGIKFVSAAGRDGGYMCGQQFIKPEMQPVEVSYNKYAQFDVGVSLEHYFN